MRWAGGGPCDARAQWWRGLLTPIMEDGNAAGGGAAKATTGVGGTKTAAWGAGGGARDQDGGQDAGGRRRDRDGGRPNDGRERESARSDGEQPPHSRHGDER